MMRLTSASSSWSLVGKDRPDSIFDLHHSEIDQAAEGVSEKIEHCALKRNQLDRPRFEPLAASKGEQPADEIASLFSGPPSHCEHALLLFAELGAPLNEAKSANDCREQIVEVVGNAPGELADRVHLLGLDQLAFERTLVA